MRRGLWIFAGLALLAFSLAARGGDALSAIKKIRAFPLQTYALADLAPAAKLSEADVLPLDKLRVTGFWPDRRYLLIERFEDTFLIDYAAVEMSDQAAWDARMAVAGPLTCWSPPFALRALGDKSADTTHATKSWIPTEKPC